MKKLKSYQDFNFDKILEKWSISDPFGNKAKKTKKLEDEKLKDESEKKQSDENKLENIKKELFADGAESPYTEYKLVYVMTKLSKMVNEKLSDVSREANIFVVYDENSSGYKEGKGGYWEKRKISIMIHHNLELPKLNDSIYLNQSEKPFSAAVESDIAKMKENKQAIMDKLGLLTDEYFNKFVSMYEEKIKKIPELGFEQAKNDSFKYLSIKDSAKRSIIAAYKILNGKVDMNNDLLIIKELYGQNYFDKMISGLIREYITPLEMSNQSKSIYSKYILSNIKDKFYVEMSKGEKISTFLQSIAKDVKNQNKQQNN